MLGRMGQGPQEAWDQAEKSGTKMSLHTFKKYHPLFKAPPVDHILSDLSTMTRPSWVAPHGMAHSFIELDKAVVHVLSLINFLSLWFSVCLPSDG